MLKSSYEPYGGGPVPLTGTDVSNGDRCLPRYSKKIWFFSSEIQHYSTASATETYNREIAPAYLLLNATKFIFLVLFYTVVKIFFGF